MDHRSISERVVRVVDSSNRMNRRRLYRHGGPDHKYCGDGWGLLVRHARRGMGGRLLLRPRGGPTLSDGGSSSGWWGLVAWWGSWSLWEEFLRVVVSCSSAVRRADVGVVGLVGAVRRVAGFVGVVR